MGLHHPLNCNACIERRIYADAWMAPPRHPHRDGTLSGSTKSQWGHIRKRIVQTERHDQDFATSSARDRPSQERTYD